MTKLQLKSYLFTGIGPVGRSIIRYLPYVAAIVFIKIFTIMLMIDSMSRNGNKMENVDEAGHSLIGSSTGSSPNNPRPLTQPPRASMPNTFPPHLPHPLRRNTVAAVKEKLMVLNRLSDSVLPSSLSSLLVSNPTYQNRTPPETFWLFFNRIPRTGSQTLVSLLEDLGEELGNQHQKHEYRTPWQRLLAMEEQKNLASWFEYNLWPTSYDRFALFINFTEHRSKYVRTNPSYISLLRDPVAQFISNFHSSRNDRIKTKKEITIREKREPGEGRRWYLRNLDECVLENDPECALDKGQSNFLSPIPFFCGQEDRCLKKGDKWALQKAKYTIEAEYSVVGITEKWNSTLNVLEHYIPLFFRGASQRYWRLDFVPKMKNKNSKAHRPPSVKVMRILNERLALEIELYHFAVQRLYIQEESVKRFMSMTSKLPMRTPKPKLFAPWERFEVEYRENFNQKDI